MTEEELLRQLEVVDDRRIWVIAEAVRRRIPQEKIHEITRIDLWFIDKIAILTEMEAALRTQPLTEELLREAKASGISGLPDWKAERQDGRGSQKTASGCRHRGCL